MAKERDGGVAKGQHLGDPFLSTSFNEKDIRPWGTAAERQRRYERDVSRLLERRVEFVDVPCPACGVDEASVRFVKYTLTYRQCRECDTLFISPRPSGAVLLDYYAESEAYAYWNDVVFPSSEEIRREHICRPRVDRLLELCRIRGVRTNVLVEVGAGFGTFCEEVRSRSVFNRVVAVEPAPSLAETCRRRGLEVIESRLEDCSPNHRADVVVCFELIEHVFDPMAFLERCRRLLTPEGVLVLTCPNAKGFDIELMGPISPSVDAEHLNYFHPDSLAMLLGRSGFKLIESATPGQLDAEIVRNRVLAGEFKLTDGFLRRVLLDEWERLGRPFQAFLSNHGLSSHMWVVAARAR